jgi:hypothetical protein
MSESSIKGIKNFIDWCPQGDSFLQQRYDMFIERKAVVDGRTNIGIDYNSGVKYNRSSFS